MVNTGRPSRGCGLCRKRRVKCDEGQPHCGNCTRLGKHCPGYRDSVDVLFRTKFTVINSKGGVRARCVIKSVDSPALLDPRKIQHGAELNILASHAWWPLTPDAAMTEDVKSPGAFMPYTDRWSLASTPSISPDIQQHSICHFLSTYVFNPRITYNQTYNSFIPSMVVNAEPASCLPSALKATAKASFANYWGPGALQTEVRRDYSIALAKMNAALRKPTERVKDETLLAVWLLGIFEYVTGYTMSSKPPGEAWQSHTDGTLTLMRLRGKDQLLSTRGRQLFRLCHVAVLWSALAYSVELPRDFWSLVVDIYERDSDSSPTSARIVYYIGRVLVLRSKVRRQRASGDTKLDDWLQTIQEGEELDTKIELRSCNEAGWETFHFKCDPCESHLMPYAPHSLYYYRTALVHLHWSRYHVARVMLHEALISALECTMLHGFPTGALENQKPAYEAKLNAAADEFIGSYSFAIGDINEYGEHRQTQFRDSDAPSRIPDFDVIGAIRFMLFLSGLRFCKYLGQAQMQAIRIGLDRIHYEMRIS